MSPKASVVPRPVEDNNRLAALITQVRSAEVIDGVKESLEALPALLAQEGVAENAALYKNAQELLQWLGDRSTASAMAEGSEIAAKLQHAVGAAPYLGLNDDDVQGINKNLAIWTRLSNRNTAAPARRRRAATSPSRRSREDLSSIRAWARSNNYDVKDRGRIPAAIIEEYQAAHA